MPSQKSHRLRKITQILARHGLGHLTGVFGLERFVPFHKGLLGHPRRAEPYRQAEHTRMALEELGATFIKLGQIISTRADLVSPEYQAELTKLQDDIPPVPFERIEEVIVAELGRPLDQLFATFDREPLAAASIGQAHTATLHDGTEVVVKVRRPGMVDQVEADLEILNTLAAAASRRWELAEHYDAVGLAQEFAQTLRAELDYITEAHNAERIAANFADDDTVHIPRVFWDTTTSRVLTLERMSGIKINDLAALDSAGIDRPALAERAANIGLTMVLEHGFFHADPHPGNFFIEPDGRIALIDFGMVGTVDARTREQLTGLFLAIGGQDPAQLADAMLDLGFARRRVDRAALERDLGQLLDRYHDQPLGKMVLAEVLNDTLAVVRRHRLYLPSNVALLFKTLTMSEGMGAQLDPDFRLIAVLAARADGILRQQFDPREMAKRLGQVGLDTARFGAELPRLLRRLASQLEHGSLEFGVHPEGFEPTLRRMERMANRIVLGIIVAALANGLAVLLAVYHPPTWQQWAGGTFAVGIALFVGLGAYLLYSIFNTGRR